MSPRQAREVLRELVDAVNRRTTLAWAIRYSPRHPDTVIAEAWRVTASSRLMMVRDFRRSLLERVGIDPEELVDGEDDGAPLWTSEREWDAWWNRQIARIVSTMEAPAFSELVSPICYERLAPSLRSV